MSAIQECGNAYAAVTQVDVAIGETEQRRLEQQAESIVGSLATLDALGLALGHPARARRLPGHLVALTRPGGRVAVQEYDLDELSDVRLEAETAFVPFGDARMEVVLDAFALLGGIAERAGAMLAAEYRGLV